MIDRLLVTDSLPIRQIATQFHLTEASLRRHKGAHLPDRLLLAKDAAGRLEAGSLLDRLLAVRQETIAVLQEARKARNQDLRLRALARLEKQIELEGRLIGELRSGGPEVTVTVDQQERLADPKTIALMELEALAAQMPEPLRLRVAAWPGWVRQQRLSAQMAEIRAERQRLGLEPGSGPG